MPDNLRRTIAAFLGLGGCYGLALALAVIGGLHDPGYDTLRAVGLGVCLMGLSVVAGYLLWRDLSLGYSLGILSLALQTLFVDVPGLTYSFYTTGQAVVWMGSTLNIGAIVEWGSGFQGLLLTEPEQARLGINLLSGFLCWRLARVSQTRGTAPGSAPPLASA